MTLRILDTDHVSLLQRQHPQVQQQFDQFDSAQVVVTIITVEEQLRGRLNLIRRAKTPAQLIFAYEALLRNVEYFNTIAILPYDQAASDRYTNLVTQKIRVGRQDLKIAAIALSQDAILVTRNQRDFAQIPGLQCENWTS